MAHWIWQQRDWPKFCWQDTQVLPLLRSVYKKLGELSGKAAISPEDRASELDTLLANIVASSAIENEQLNVQSVRSSLARRLGISERQPYPVSDRSEGLSEMMMDAIEQADKRLTKARLLKWHHGLFVNHTGVLHNVAAGQLRGDEPMQVVSGRIDKPVVHFEAPPRSALKSELTQFIHWFNQSRDEPLLDPLIRAAICHLWLITLHPFDDGNGRITRALTDMALAQADRQSIRLYAMSVAILARREAYYAILEQTQKNGLDITQWVLWFLETLEITVNNALAAIDNTLIKSRFWSEYRDIEFNAQQIKVLNRLLDGDFQQGISASQYQKVGKVSKATATRHLTDLVQKGCLEKLTGGGRSTRYHVVCRSELQGLR